MKSIKTSILNSLILLSITSIFSLAKADDRFLLYAAKNFRIAVYDYDAKVESILYDSTGDFYFNDLKVSPSIPYIAAIRTIRGYTPRDAHDYSILPKNALVFLDTAGKVIAALDEDVRKYSWGPEGDKVAFIAGTYYEGGVGFRITGVGIFDLKSGRIIKIKKDFPHGTIKRLDGSINEGGGYELYWAKHDTNIYIQDFDYMGGIYRYNTKLGKSEKVDLKGIDISPDGKYYKELEGIRIYRTQTNEDITEQLISRFGPEWSRVYLRWVFDKGHCLHIVNYGKEPIGKTATGHDKYRFPVKQNVLYDVEQDRVVRDMTSLPIELKGWPSNFWFTAADAFVFKQEGEFVVWTYEDVYGE